MWFGYMEWMYESIIAKERKKEQTGTRKEDNGHEERFRIKYILKNASMKILMNVNEWFLKIV